MGKKSDRREKRIAAAMARQTKEEPSIPEKKSGSLTQQRVGSYFNPGKMTGLLGLLALTGYFDDKKKR